MSKKSKAKSTENKVTDDKQEKIEVEAIEVVEPVVVEPIVEETVIEEPKSKDQSKAPVKTKIASARQILSAYLASGKRMDNIKQLKKGGNYVSKINGEIYIPLTVVNKIIESK